MPEVERQKFCRTQSQQNVHKEASDKCSFAKISVNNKDWCNGRGKQGKDALNVCAQGLCKDAKPTKHTQTLTLRKARGIVRFWEGWCGRGVVWQSLRLDGRKV